MKQRFTHILNLAVIGTLIAGMLSHLLFPLFGDAQKTAFTQWLDQNVIATGGETELKLRSAIRELPKNTADFQSLVQEASQLIATHKEDFRIAPFASEEEHKNVSSWLIGQWSVFKLQQNGVNAILPEVVKPIQKWISESDFNLSSTAPANTATLQRSEYFIEIITPVFLNRALSPLVSGISINAPPTAAD